MDKKQNADLSEVEKAIGYTFKNKELLAAALTHASYVNEHGGKSYERLEFLGDSLVNFLVAEALYGSGQDEGTMTERRQHIVSKKPLADAVDRLGLADHVRRGNGNDAFSVKKVSDLFESVCAAVYLDGGLEPCRKFVLGNLRECEAI